MISDPNENICGLVTEDVIPVNDTAAFINDAVLVAVNVPFCVFAILSNLVVIVAVVKKPVLHKPCYMLLCSLAFADCLTGVIAQPLFIARRLMIHRAHMSCDYQLELYELNHWTFRMTALLSFVNMSVMSFDRYSALSKPLQYRATANNRGKWSYNGIMLLMELCVAHFLLACIIGKSLKCSSFHSIVFENLYCNTNQKSAISKFVWCQPITMKWCSPFHIKHVRFQPFQIVDFRAVLYPARPSFFLFRLKFYWTYYIGD